MLDERSLIKVTDLLDKKDASYVGGFSVRTLGRTLKWAFRGNHDMANTQTPATRRAVQHVRVLFTAGSEQYRMAPGI
jgi:hypothetical protein